MLTGMLWSADTPASELLWSVLTGAYSTLGFDAAGDETFKTLVCARLVEPTSKLDTIWVLEDLGVEPPHRNTINASLARCVDRGYRTEIATACWRHATADDGPGAALNGSVNLTVYLCLCSGLVAVG